MSNFTKGEGAKIVVKFDKPLIGDVSGNEQAFTITAQEPQWVEFPSGELGNLIDSDIQIESVEAYPPIQYYNEDFVGGTFTNVEFTNSVLKLEVE